MTGNDLIRAFDKLRPEMLDFRLYVRLANILAVVGELAKQLDRENRIVDRSPDADA